MSQVACECSILWVFATLYPTSSKRHKLNESSKYHEHNDRQNALVCAHVCVYECVYALPLIVFLDYRISYAIQTSRTHSVCHELDDRQNAPTSFPHIWAPPRCNCCGTAQRLSSLPTLGASNISEVTFRLITLSAFIRAPWALLLWLLCCMLQWALW